MCVISFVGILAPAGVKSCRQLAKFFAASHYICDFGHKFFAASH